MDGSSWFGIPDDIVLQIFSYLSQKDRYNLSLVCKDWSAIFHDSQLWSRFVFKFDTNYDKDGRAITCAEKYGEELKDIEIDVNQAEPISLKRALTVLDNLIAVKKWKVIKFKFVFTGWNPPLFNGRLILNKVKDFLSSIKDKDCIFNLEVIDLSKLGIVLDNGLLKILADYHKRLKIVNIQNRCLVDNITEDCVMSLLRSCVYIEEFYAFYHHVDDEVLEILSEDGRTKIRKLSFMCNRSDKYKSMISSEAWESLKKFSPDMELEMKFHSTMPLYMVNQLLCPEIPATFIDLHIYAWVHEQIHHIAKTCNKTLKYLSCHTDLDPDSTANNELTPALLELAVQCEDLEELHCHCNLPESTINSIKAIRSLKSSTLYTNLGHGN